jgi:hypothetical protein
MFVVMPNSPNRFSQRILALAFLFSVLGCSRATSPVPTAATSAASGAANATRAPGEKTTDGWRGSATAKPPAAIPASAAPSIVAPPVVASAPPPAHPAPNLRANLWTKPQDCSAYDTSPDYRGLSAEDRAHGRLTCETKEEFRVFVATRQACKAASDCALVSGSCPFDCYVPIAKASEHEVRAKLDALAARLDKAGNRCMYGCISSPGVECVDGRCDTGNR